MKILFVCTLNAVRSPMAEALAKEAFPNHQFYSAGLIEGPADYFAIEVMKEIGLDISKRKTKSVAEYKNEKFDRIICLADEVKKSAADFLNKSGAKVEYWDVPSPGLIGGNRIMKLFGYREIRDKIRSQIRLLSL
jgi:protein-tyrosine-phosphatase